MATATSPVPFTGLVPRSRLLGRLIAAQDTPLVLLVAPAGYGKTTLLAEWAERDGRPFAWVDLRRSERGAERLLCSIADALADAGAVEHASNERLAAVCDAFMQAGTVLVLDGAELLDSCEAMAVVSTLIEHAVDGAQVALAARSEPALGLGSLRARRKLLELRTADLAMTASEAAALAESHGLRVDRAALEQLLRRTEGWPAGLYLAALAAGDEGELVDFAGDDRFLADYFREEALAPLTGDQAAFLARSSILDRLSGPLCDFVLERDDSGPLLQGLSRMNLMLVPLDRRDREYRYHRLFAEALRGELRRSEPQVEASLHSRASTWYDEHGDPERAIAHAVEGGDVARAGDLLWARAADMVGYGADGGLERWLERFTPAQLAGCPKLALAAAATSLLSGERELVERWTAAALDGAGPGPLEGEAQLFRAAMADDAVAGTGREAASACERVPERSPWRALGDLLQGIARHLTGDRDGARVLLEQGTRRAAPGSPSLQALCLAQLALLAVDAEDWDAAEACASRARAQAERSGFDRYPTSALVYAVSAEVHAHLGRVEASKIALDDAARLLCALPDFSSWYGAECNIALARAALRLSDVQRARSLVDQAERLLRRCPDAEVALAWVHDCRSQTVLSTAASAGDEWCLTTAELRILQFLPTYLSLREIAERLYVSANTVKTHARSVYRKLGASSRGDAVVRAREVGLLDEAFHAGVGSAAM